MDEIACVRLDCVAHEFMLSALSDGFFAGNITYKAVHRSASKPKFAVANCYSTMRMLLNGQGRCDRDQTATVDDSRFDVSSRLFNDGTGTACGGGAQR